MKKLILSIVLTNSLLCLSLQSTWDFNRRLNNWNSQIKNTFNSAIYYITYPYYYKQYKEKKYLQEVFNILKKINTEELKNNQLLHNIFNNFNYNIPDNLNLIITNTIDKTIPREYIDLYDNSIVNPTIDDMIKNLSKEKKSIVMNNIQMIYYKDNKSSFSIEFKK